MAELRPADEVESLRSRTHVARILGIGHQRSIGLKGGVVVDLEAAESAIRQAVHAAERMAKVEIQSVIVNLTGGRLASEHFEAHVPVRGAVGQGDVHRVLDAASSTTCGAAAPSCMPCPPASRSMRRTTSSIPAGMIGERLGADLHVVTPRRLPRAT